VIVNGQLLAMTKMYQDIAKWLVGAFQFCCGVDDQNEDLSGKYVPVFGLHGYQRAKCRTERVVAIVMAKQSLSCEGHFVTTARSGE
jgi:hypothetical protein